MKVIYIPGEQDWDAEFFAYKATVINLELWEQIKKDGKFIFDNGDSTGIDSYIVAEAIEFPDVDKGFLDFIKNRMLYAFFNKFLSTRNFFIVDE